MTSSRNTLVSAVGRFVRRDSAWVDVVLLLVPWVAFSVPYFGEGVPYYRDVLRTDLPLLEFMGQSLRSFHLPQWYPFDGLGLQLIGNAEGLFHPTTWLFAALPAMAGLVLEITSSSLAGLVGMVLLGRRLGLGLPARLTAAVAFALSGYPVSLESNLPYLRPYHTIPWVVWAALAALGDQRVGRWIAATAVLWASVFLGGDPLLFILLGLTLAPLALVMRPPARLWRLGVAGALALLLSAVELVPALTLFRESDRAQWSPGPWVGKLLALGSARIPELWLGGFWRNRGQELLLRYALDGSPELWAVSLFVGATVLVLAVASLRRDRTLVWPALAVFYFWLALGDAGGLHPLLRALLPPLARFRYPEKFMSLVVFALACSAGIGFQRLSPRRWLVSALGLSAVTAAVLLGNRAWLTRVLGERATPRLVADAGQAFGQGALATLAVCAAVTLALWAARRRPAAALAVPALVAGELLLASHHLHYVVPRVLFEHPPAFCLAAERAGLGLGRARVLTRVSNYPTLYDATEGPAWAEITLNLMEPDNGALCGVESIRPPNLSGVPYRLAKALRVLPPEQVTQLFNVGAWVLEDASASSGATLAHIPGYALVHPAVATRARAYAADAMAVRDGDEALHRLARPLPEGAVAVEELPPQPPPGEPSGQVRVQDYAPDEVVLDVDLPRAQEVVLNDLWAPGWTATVDGTPTPIHRANYLVRAVSCPAGHHRVAFSFATPGLRLAAWLTLLALAGCGVLWFIWR